MLKLLIADDEPLIQIGLQSMLDWNALGIEICGTASNGDIAYEMILKHQPEIVITDIQMPCLSGLELAKRCIEELGTIPVFIILSSHEDFKYAQEAIRLQAIDYLVKIDLTPETLTASIKKAIAEIHFRQQEAPVTKTTVGNLPLFHERFYICLLNNLFESEKHFAQQMDEFHIQLKAKGYVAAKIKFIPPISYNVSTDLMQIYQQTLHMFQELINKYLPCHIIALDTQYFAGIFLFDTVNVNKWMAFMTSALNNTFDMLMKYYNVNFMVSIGRLVTDPLDLSISYYDAKQIAELLSTDTPMIFWESATDIGLLKNVFNLSIFRSEIVCAFEELDESVLKNTLDEIINLLSEDNNHYTQALDVASSILHLSINLLSNGLEIVNNIFSHEPDSYCSLYRQKSSASIINWLRTLEHGLCEFFTNEKFTRKHYLVDNCCKYINEHIREKIVLQNIADAFDVSPNYLGQLFKKHMDIRITEYITNQKIVEAKRLLKNTTLRIYEISELLGFENAFYFSKVFKKTTGISPKDFRNT